MCSFVSCPPVLTLTQPVYHSAYNAIEGATEICGCVVLPVKTKAKGPAQNLDVAGELRAHGLARVDPRSSLIRDARPILSPRTRSQGG